MIKVAPSILSADFGRLDEEMAALEEHVDMWHVDVMDGHFVPNITIGAPVVKCLDAKKPFDVHLMIENPEKYVKDFVEAGSDRLVVHAEACRDLEGVIQLIHDLGAEAGVAIKPGTSVSDIEGVLKNLEEVLVMTVEPGFGGQKFMTEMIPKIKELRDLGYEGDIGVDGGVSDQNCGLLKEAGATLLVAGSFIFKAEDRVEAIKSLR